MKRGGVPQRPLFWKGMGNKIWNASRFVMMNLTIDEVTLPEKLELEDKWVLSKLNTLIREVTENIGNLTTLFLVRNCSWKK